MNPSSRHPSTLVNHPDVAPVLPLFVGRLPGHVARLREFLAAGNRAELLRLAHQLRGSGRSFGFEGITDLAAKVEDMLLAGKTLADTASVVERLAAYIENVEGYPPTR
jgi:HPt (histidine-containing phosphotransfer) domain-containing protein